eukprot:TRINITY_DN127743_c0_g1_i1.p1 TRINITY_DN127743_c0_g1~~TRINITY_DN127743_c0_g1_i1.p1  ORF type:complete len:104 (-),score=7.44 TRINITY_DN127743_c0_g1_i1:22-333(-)
MLNRRSTLSQVDIKKGKHGCSNKKNAIGVIRESIREDLETNQDFQIRLVQFNIVSLNFIATKANQCQTKKQAQQNFSFLKTDLDNSASNLKSLVEENSFLFPV